MNDELLKAGFIMAACGVFLIATAGPKRMFSAIAELARPRKTPKRIRTKIK